MVKYLFLVLEKLRYNFSYRTRHANTVPGPAGVWPGGDPARDCEILPAPGYQEDEAGLQVLVAGSGGSSGLAGFPDKAHT